MTFLGMFTAAYTLMDRDTWQTCQSTTNPVEAINRESVPKDGRQTSLVEILGHLYRSDKVYASKKVAAINNITTSYRNKSQSSQEARRERKRTWRRRSDFCDDRNAEGITIIHLPFYISSISISRTSK